LRHRGSHSGAGTAVKRSSLLYDTRHTCTITTVQVRNHRPADTSQLRRRRSARSVSVPSSPRCSLGSSSRPTLRRPRGSLGAIKAQNRADDVACEGRHPNHASRHEVVLFDLRPLTFSRRRMAAEARILHSRLRMRSSHSVSVSSQPRCSPRFTFGACTESATCALESDRNS